MRKYFLSIVALAIAVCCSSYTVKHDTVDYWVTGVDPTNTYYFVQTTPSPYCGTGSTYACHIITDQPGFILGGRLAVPQIEASVVSRALWYP